LSLLDDAGTPSQDLFDRLLADLRVSRAVSFGRDRTAIDGLIQRVSIYGKKGETEEEGIKLIRKSIETDRNAWVEKIPVKINAKGKPRDNRWASLCDKESIVFEQRLIWVRSNA
jgi:hypothetical protein